MKNWMHSALVGVLLVGAAQGRGQNLVPNGSFEDYTLCPDYASQIDRVVGWESNGYTPDYFNACDSTANGYASVPNNYFCYQMAAEGQAYVGGISFTEGGDSLAALHREHVGRYLSSPLIPGAPVHLSMKVSPAAVSTNFPAGVRWSCKGMGMRFTMGPIDILNPLAPINAAAIYLDEVLLDTAGWTTVSGVFIPDSAYTYIVVGNFFDDSLSTPILVDSTAQYGVAYTFVDDVCVSYDPSDCDIGSGLPDVAQALIRAWPNPFTSELRIALPAGVERIAIEMVDLVGRVCWIGFAEAGVTVLSLRDAEVVPGTYILRCVGSQLKVCPFTVVRSN